MAVRSYTEIDTKWGTGSAAKVYEWTGLLNGDTGAPLRIPPYADITVQVMNKDAAAVQSVLGTGGTVTWNGTLDDATTPAAGQYGVLHKTDGSTSLTQNALGRLDQVLEHPLQIQPSITAGDGTTTLCVRVHVVKQWRD